MKITLLHHSCACMNDTFFKHPVICEQGLKCYVLPNSKQSKQITNSKSPHSSLSIAITVKVGDGWYSRAVKFIIV